jgi:putative sigma-54 modulation protein
MNVTVSGRHITVPAAARDEVRRQLERLDRVLGDAAISAQCVIARDGIDYTCELTVRARGDHTLHARARHARLGAAVSGAAQKASQQAHRLKDRWARRRKGAGVPRAAAPLRPEPAPAGLRRRIVRARASAIKPLSLDDAVLALESSREGVVVFRQADTGSVAIVYRRPDGHVGLVEPEA